MADDPSDPPDPPKGEYKVGYGCPPREHEIKLGERRNPHGRPKGSQNKKTIFGRELKKTLKCTENGNPCRRTMYELGIIQLVKKHAQGNLRATEMILRHWKPPEEINSSDAPSAKRSEIEEQILQNLLARAARRNDPV